MANLHPNILLVEGKQDLRVIPQLIEANGISWGTPKQPVVYIRDCGGERSVIDPDVIATELQASGLVALGIMIDADEDPAARWQSLRNASKDRIPDLPETLPETGLIHDAPNGIRFGIWMMPDNRMRGMLETFLAYMIPDGGEALWEFAQATTQDVQQNYAVRFKAAHLDKANIYTWLAWQNPPGQQLHQSIMQRILDPKHSKSQKFVTWFKNLYGLI
jgi:hypothetical protein